MIRGIENLEKSDIWSVGILLYTAIMGRPPFVGKGKKEIMVQIKKGLVFDEDDWIIYSEDLKDLIRKMLKYDHKLRISAQEALNHPWIINQDNDVKINPENLKQLAKYHGQNILEKSILYFISSQLSENNEEQQIAELFNALDLNHDGRLSKEELLQGSDLLNLKDPSEVDKIMKNCDTDGNGYLEFSEFVTATTI